MEKRFLKKEAAVLERLQRVKGEIKHYPTPIAGCDGQLDFLLSEHARLTRELFELRRSWGQSRDLRGRAGE